MSTSAHLDDFLVELGADLIRSSQTVDDVERQLSEIGHVAGADDFDVLALPTAIMLESRASGSLRSRLRSIREPSLRLDQVESVDGLARRARLGRVTPVEGLAELEQIRTRRPPFPRAVRSMGLGLLAAGFSLALQPTLPGVLLSLVIGTAVGAFLSLELTALAPITPTLVTFVVALVVFWLSDTYEGENPIRYLIPPLIIFLPGAKITAGTIELAEGAMVSGSSRLVSGLMELLLLATAIVAAGALVNLPSREFIDRPVDQLGTWTVVPSLALITLGYHFYSCAPRRTVPWIFLVLSVALAGEMLASLVFSSSVSAFFGAVAMTPVVLAIDRRPDGPRAMTLFLPGFYLLVPGATGLIDVTASVSPGFGGDLTSTMVVVVAIALGVLIATAGVRSVAEVRASWRMRRTTATG